MSTTACCPYCTEVLPLAEEGVFPYHDYPKPTRRVCSGSKKTPEDANWEFLQWKEVVKEANG